MEFRNWATRVILIFLMFSAMILALFLGQGRKHQVSTSYPDNTVWNQYPQVKFQSERTIEKLSPKLTPSPVKKKTNLSTKYTTTEAFNKYKPNIEISSIHPSNYGERYVKDINGIPLNNQPIIVIHETTNSASSAVNFFQTPHDDENVQASYHSLIKLDGTVVYLIPPEKRAFGAANSIFVSANGEETVQTNLNLPPSVNNFAYHVSLETPLDGREENRNQTHSGYTEAEYNSLAWLIAQSQIPSDRITTHRIVDRSGQRIDPRSFDFDKFFSLLNVYRESTLSHTAKK